MVLGTLKSSSYPSVFKYWNIASFLLLDPVNWFNQLFLDCSLSNWIPRDGCWLLCCMKFELEVKSLCQVIVTNEVCWKVIKLFVKYVECRSVNYPSVGWKMYPLIIQWPLTATLIDPFQILCITFCRVKLLSLSHSANVYGVR